MSDVFRNSVDKAIYLTGGKQTLLAKALGTSQQTVSRWREQGYFPPARWHRVTKLLKPHLTLEDVCKDYISKKGAANEESLSQQQQ